MTNIEMKVKGAYASAVIEGQLTSGMVGATVHVTFDEAWNGLAPRLVATNGYVSKPMVIDGLGNAILPWEICRKNATIYIGAEGVNEDGTIVIPTVMARVDEVRKSPKDLEVTDSSAPPTPDEKEQIRAMAYAASTEAAAAHEAVEALQQDAADGKFNGKDGYSPYISTGGNWMEWSDTLQQYVDTGIPARGEGGGVDSEVLKEYAKQEWVRKQGYLTEHQSLAEYAKKADIPEAYDDSEIKEDLSQLEQTINGKYTKPNTGIPASDLAAGVIPPTVTDAHINSLIDTKLTPIDALADDITEVVGA